MGCTKYGTITATYHSATNVVLMMTWEGIYNDRPVVVVWTGADQAISITFAAVGDEPADLWWRAVYTGHNESTMRLCFHNELEINRSLEYAWNKSGAPAVGTTIEPAVVPYDFTQDDGLAP